VNYRKYKNALRFALDKLPEKLNNSNEVVHNFLPKKYITKLWKLRRPLRFAQGPQEKAAYPPAA
jgi:hypothetical protein